MEVPGLLAFDKKEGAEEEEEKGGGKGARRAENFSRCTEEGHGDEKRRKPRDSQWRSPSWLVAERVRELQGTSNEIPKCQ